MIVSKMTHHRQPLTQNSMKTISGTFRTDHLALLFPQISPFILDEEKLAGFVKRHFQGAAQSFQIQINDERVSVVWTAPRAGAEAEALNREALALAKSRHYERAAELWRKAILLYKDEPDYHYNLSLTLVEMKQFIKALDRCKEALNICPIYYRACFVLGSLYSKQRQFEASEQYLRQGLLLQPDNTTALVNLGAVLTVQRKYDDAVHTFEKTVALSPKDSKAYLGLGKVYVMQNDFDNAARCFKAVIKIDPNGRLGQIAQTSLAALPIMKEGSDGTAAPGDADRLYANAYNAYLHGNYAAAVDLYADYLKIKPRDEHAWSTMAACRLRLGQKSESIQAINNAIQLSPGTAALHKQAGIIYDAFDMPSELEHEAQRALELGKQDSVTITLLGIAKLKSNQTQESIRILQDAVDKNPNNLKARFYLSKAYLVLNQKELAKQNLEEILWSQTASPLKEMARAMLKEMK